MLPVVFLCFSLYVHTVCELRTDADYWKQLAQEELKEALQLKWNLGIAKNVILFIGDGMGPNTITATRIMKGGESHKLVYEKFPHVGLLKTYSANKMVPDSASTATAILCGVKTNHRNIGVDASVKSGDCSASLDPKARLESLAALAIKAGKSAGFVTTMRVTHGTPGPIYAHSASRSWECEDAMPNGTEHCKDIARQLVEDWPGKDLQVVLGGGRQVLVSNSTGTATDPISKWSCYRKDGKNLIDEYKKDKESRGLKYNVVYNNKELKELNIDETDCLLGIFSNAHLQYEFERDKSPSGMPSIGEMTETAIKVLKKNPKGYFLMVEGGNIDMGHHRGRAKTAISEAAALEDAVRLAVEMTDQHDTLIVVTSDHTHSLSINGYPERGSNIFGTLGPSSFDHINYTTLSYGSGGPGSFQYNASSGSIVRDNPSDKNSDDYMYEQIAAVPLEENYHGGGDVAVYARGPFAHLFHSIHEQNYVFHAIVHAAQLIPNGTGSLVNMNVMLFATSLILIFYTFIYS
ncbi:alkaline phosphatase-like [Epargyreus clarus]|uniref:alkaline phosphatase-like n=1 Tax=Epargyreus clarus TaxID=520877 RepID=UPI003C2D42B6